MRAAVLFVMLVAGALPAWGHAQLVRSDPSAGSTISRAERIVLEFDGPVERRFARFTIELADGTKRALTLGGSGLTERVELTVGTLPAGTHALRWSVVSRDGHRISGTLRFSVSATR